MINAWRSGDFTGDSRPMARVTVQHPKFRTQFVKNNTYMHFFNPDDPPKELPNILSVSWDVDVDSDTSTCTVQALNVKDLELGERPPGEDFDYPGYYTPQHGSSAFSSQWNHSENEWKGMLLPDNIIRTYEGYGFDPNVCPSRDPNLVQTGTWRIDDVDLSHDGTITINCRDVGSILIDQIAFPPIVPFEAGPTSDDAPHGKYAYPVQFVARNPAPTVANAPMDPQEVPLTFDDSSNTPYVSSKDAEVYDHRPSEAFDGDLNSFWWSVGNARPDQGYSYEWIQGKCNKSTVTSVRFWTWGTQYTVFVSIYADGEWKGEHVIPYDPNHPASAPNGSDIPFVAGGFVPDDYQGENEIVLPEPIENVTKVRLTFTNLWYSATGTYKYRADCRELLAYGGQLTREITTKYDLKNYDWYEDIVKLWLAWAGFWWPKNAYQLDCDGNQIPHPYQHEDDAITIAGGRVWGDFKGSGTYGPAPLDVDIWDKKPIMECIRYVAEILGYLSYVDETGGFVFRPPNIYQKGNLLRSLSRQSGQRTGEIVRIDERQNLKTLGSKLSSRNVRERVFVANVNGQIGHMAAGWNPNPTGLRRVGGWTDENFAYEEEARLMAEMITLRQLFTYRTDSFQIPGYPKIQIDDQVRIFERVASEGYIHYVKGISSTNNLQTGEWTYDLTTHWLGEEPFERWLFDPAQLSRETQQYLRWLYIQQGEEQI